MVSLVTAGFIVNTHGLGGLVKVKPMLNNMDLLANNNCYIKYKNGDTTTVRITSCKQQKSDIFLLKFKDLNHINDVESFVKSEILINRELLPALNDDQFYWDDLVNFKVYNLNNIFLGSVSKISNFGAQDNLEVVNVNIKYSIPFIKSEFIKDVSLENKKIICDWPEDMSSQ